MKSGPKYKKGDIVFVYEGLTCKTEKGRIISDAIFLDVFHTPDFYYQIMTETRDKMAGNCIESDGEMRKPKGDELFQFYREDASIWKEKDDRIKLVHGQLGI